MNIAKQSKKCLRKRTLVVSVENLWSSRRDGEDEDAKSWLDTGREPLKRQPRNLCFVSCRCALNVHIPNAPSLRH